MKFGMAEYIVKSHETNNWLLYHHYNEGIRAMPDNMEGFKKARCNKRLM